MWGSGPRGLLSPAHLAPPFLSVSAGAQPRVSWDSGGPRSLCWGRTPAHRRLFPLSRFAPVPPPISDLQHGQVHGEGQAHPAGRHLTDRPGTRGLRARTCDVPQTKPCQKQKAVTWHSSPHLNMVGAHL